MQECPDESPVEARALIFGLHAADTLVNLHERDWQRGDNPDADMIVSDLMVPLGVDLERRLEILHTVEGGLKAFSKLI